MTPEQVAILDLHERLLALDRRLAELEERRENEWRDLVRWASEVARAANTTLPQPPARVRRLTAHPGKGQKG